MDTRNEYRILVRHFTGKINVTEQANIKTKLHWIFEERLLGIGAEWTGSVSCPIAANFRICGY